MQPFFSIPARVCDATWAGEIGKEAPAGTSPPLPGMKGEVANGFTTSTGHRNQSKDCQMPVGSNSSEPCQSQAQLTNGQGESKATWLSRSKQTEHLSHGGNITQEGHSSRLPLMLI